MTAREKRMLAVVGVLGLCGIVFAAYQMIAVPLQQARDQAQQLRDQFAEKSATLDKMNAALKRLPSAKQRSLPADLDVARREYESNLSYLLRNAGVPSGFTIVPKDTGDARSIPELAPKKAAYTRIGYDIRMLKVELPVLVKVLKAYYDLNLLHQITHIDVKHVEKEGNSGGIARRGADRADLEVTLHTEAIILDGAEDRRTLLPVPVAVAAAVGGPGFRAVQNMPEFSKNQKALQFPSLLAVDEDKRPREYLVMEARDPFHGPLPPVITRAPAPPPVVNVNKIPPEDISPYIWLNGITTSATGLRQATIWDRSLNYVYEVTLLEEGAKPDVRVRKLSIVANRAPLPLERSKELLINQEGTATDRAFKVMGIHEDGLVLTETISDTPAKEPADPKKDPKVDPKKAAGRPAVGGRDKAPPKPTKEQVALSGMIGGVAMTQPTTTELVFHWRIGQPLSSLDPKKAMTADEAKDLLKKVAAGVATPVATPAPAPELEAAPGARTVEN